MTRDRNSGGSGDQAKEAKEPVLSAKGEGGDQAKELVFQAKGGGGDQAKEPVFTPKAGNESASELQVTFVTDPLGRKYGLYVVPAPPRAIRKPQLDSPAPRSNTPSCRCASHGPFLKPEPYHLMTEERHFERFDAVFKAAYAAHCDQVNERAKEPQYYAKGYTIHEMS